MWNFMKTTPLLDRRHFVKLGSLATAIAMVPGLAFAQSGKEETATYKLPELPYASNALEPHVDAKTMEIHHGKHHAAYINNLNAALEGKSDLSKKSLEEILTTLPSISDEALRATVRNNGGGHWNHAFFWKTLAPADKSGKPSPELAKAIEDEFKSMDEFKNAFGAAAAKRFGSGWAWLIVKDGKLKITSTANQDNPSMKGIVPDAELGTPILGLDVWEHAYYLHYQNRRPDYVSAWWSVLNWETISERYAAATK